MEREFFRNYLIEEGYSEDKIKYFFKIYPTLTEEEKSLFIYEFIPQIKEVYRTYPVDITTFINDPYYLGSIYGSGLYPIWRELFKELYPAPLIVNYDEAILSTALRAGKSTAIVISFLYEIHKLLCMVNPAKHLLNKSVARITFGIISMDTSKATAQLGLQLLEGLQNSPYFQSVITGNLAHSSMAKEGMHVANNIIIKAGSSASSLTGYDVHSFAFDEANIKPSNMKEEDFVERRVADYKALLDRRQSSLARAPQGTGIAWMTSSPLHKKDVISERILEVKSNNTDRVLIKDNVSRWIAQNTEHESYFDFFLGSDLIDPCIIEEVDVEPQYLKEGEIIKVPREHLPEFRSNARYAINNIAGRRTSSDMSLFNSVSVFKDVFSKDNNIFLKDDLRISLDSNFTLNNYLKDKNYFSNCIKPDCYRYIHLDIASKKDRFGLSSVYSDYVEFTSDDGKKIYERLYYVDFCLGISADKNTSVDIVKVLQWICNLKKLGYPLRLVTTDNHQGELAQQIIRKRGVRTGYLSVERTKDQYYFLKNIITERKLEGYKNPLLVKELSGLIDYPKKVEKGRGYTDDLSDSLAGALWNCSQDKYYKKVDNTIKSLIEINNNNGINLRTSDINTGNIHDLIKKYF